MRDCIYIDRINAYFDGELPVEQRAALVSHLAGGCAACSKQLEALQRLSMGLRLLEAPEQIQSSFIDKLHRQVDSMADRSILQFAELLSGVAAALLITASVWAMRTPSASADPMVDWERAAVTLQPETNATQQQTSLRAAEWIANNLANGAAGHE